MCLCVSQTACVSGSQKKKKTPNSKGETNNRYSDPKFKLRVSVIPVIILMRKDLRKVVIAPGTWFDSLVFLATARHLVQRLIHMTSSDSSYYGNLRNLFTCGN